MNSFLFQVNRITEWIKDNPRKFIVIILVTILVFLSFLNIHLYRKDKEVTPQDGNSTSEAATSYDLPPKATTTLANTTEPTTKPSEESTTAATEVFSTVEETTTKITTTSPTLGNNVVTTTRESSTKVSESSTISNTTQPSTAVSAEMEKVVSYLKEGNGLLWVWDFILVSPGSQNTSDLGAFSKLDNVYALPILDANQNPQIKKGCVMISVSGEPYWAIITAIAPAPKGASANLTKDFVRPSYE